jgi:hypothetical protein
MGIYDDPRAGVANSLMQQQQRARPFDPGQLSNTNSLFGGGAPPPGGFGMASAPPPAAPTTPMGAPPGGGLGMAGGGIVPQQPQQNMFGYGPIDDSGMWKSAGLASPTSDPGPRFGQLDAGTGSGALPPGQLPQMRARPTTPYGQPPAWGGFGSFG